MANPVAISSDTRRRQPEEPADPVGAGESGQHHGRDQQQRGPAQAQHVAEADFQAQHHDPGPHQVLAGEVQPGPRRPGGPAGHARQVGRQQPEDHGQGHRRQRGKQQVDGDGDGDGGCGAGQAWRGLASGPEAAADFVGGHAPTLAVPGRKSRNRGRPCRAARTARPALSAAPRAAEMISEQKSGWLVTMSDLFQDYSEAAGRTGAYDEMFAPGQQARKSYGQVAGALRELSLADVSARADSMAPDLPGPRRDLRLRGRGAAVPPGHRPPGDPGRRVERPGTRCGPARPRPRSLPQ